jgi:hypothetical protein
MNADQIEIQLLYEKMLYKHLDYLLIENVDNFDWNEFFRQYKMAYYNYNPKCIFEDYKRIESTDKADIYKIFFKEHLDLDFTLQINLLPKKYLEDKILTLTYSVKSPVLIKDLKNTIEKTKENILYVAFQDKNQNKNITGEVGNYSWSVMKGVEHCILDHYTFRNSLPDILIFRVYKNENRRIELYKNFFKNVVAHGLTNTLIDDSDSQILEIYNWKSLP